MKHPAHMYSTGEIAKQVRSAHDDTKKLLTQLGFKPLREVRIGNGKTFRYWHKDALYAAAAHLEEKRKKIEEQFSEAPVQATLPLERLEEAVGAAKEMADKMRVIPEAPKMPALDITVLETKHAEEMLSVLRSIDQRLYELMVIWSK
jgi:hypothetical protein